MPALSLARLGMGQELLVSCKAMSDATEIGMTVGTQGLGRLGSGCGFYGCIGVGARLEGLA